MMNTRDYARANTICCRFERELKLIDSFNCRLLLLECVIDNWGPKYSAAKLLMCISDHGQYQTTYFPVNFMSISNSC